MIKITNITCLDSWLNKSKVNYIEYNASGSNQAFSIETASELYIKVKFKLLKKSPILFTDDNLNYAEFLPDKGLEYELTLTFQNNNSHNKYVKIFNADLIEELHLNDIDVVSFKSSTENNNSLKLLDVHNNRITALDVSSFKKLRYLHIFNNPIVDELSYRNNLYDLVKGLPERENYNIGSIILYPWYGLETLVYFSDGKYITKDAADRIRNDLTTSYLPSLINNAAKVPINTVCKYPRKLEFRGPIKLPQNGVYTNIPIIANHTYQLSIDHKGNSGFAISLATDESNQILGNYLKDVSGASETNVNYSVNDDIIFTTYTKTFKAKTGGTYRLYLYNSQGNYQDSFFINPKLYDITDLAEGQPTDDLTNLIKNPTFNPGSQSDPNVTWVNYINGTIESNLKTADGQTVRGLHLYKVVGLDDKQRDEFYYDVPVTEIKHSIDDTNKSILYAFAVTNQSAKIAKQTYQSGAQYEARLCATIDTDNNDNVFSTNSTVKFSTTENLRVGDQLSLLNGDSGEIITASVIDILDNDFVTVNYEFNTFRYNTKWYAFNNSYIDFGDIKFDFNNYLMYQNFQAMPAEYGLIYATYDFNRSGWRVHELTDYNYLRVYLEDAYCCKKNWFFGSAIQYYDADWSKCWHWFTETGAQDIWETTQKGFGLTISCKDNIGGLIDGDYANTDLWTNHCNILRFENSYGITCEPETRNAANWKNGSYGHGDACLTIGVSRGNYSFGLTPNASIFAQDITRGVIQGGLLNVAKVNKEMFDFSDMSTSSITYTQTSKQLSAIRYAQNMAGRFKPAFQAAGNDGDGVPFHFDTSAYGGAAKPWTKTKAELGAISCESGDYGFTLNRDSYNQDNFDVTNYKSSVHIVQAVSKDFSISSFADKSTDVNLNLGTYKNYINAFGDMAIMYRANRGNFGKFNGSSCATPVACFSVALLQNLYNRKSISYYSSAGLYSYFMDYVKANWCKSLNHLPNTVSNSGLFTVKYSNDNSQITTIDSIDDFSVELQNDIVSVGDKLLLSAMVNNKATEDYFISMPMYKNQDNNVNTQINQKSINYDYSLIAIDEDTNEAIAIQDTSNINSPITLYVSYTGAKLNNVSSNDTDDLSISLTRYINNYSCSRGNKSFTYIIDDSYEDSDIINDAADALYESSQGSLSLKDQAFSDCDELTISIVHYASLTEIPTSGSIVNYIIGFYYNDSGENTSYYPLTFNITNSTNYAAPFLYYMSKAPYSDDYREYCEANNISIGSTFNLANEQIIYGILGSINHNTQYYYNNTSLISDDDYHYNNFTITDRRNIITLTFSGNTVTYYMNGNKIRSFQMHRPMNLGKLVIAKEYLDPTADIQYLVYPRRLSNSEIISNTIALINQ